MRASALTVGHMLAVPLDKRSRATLLKENFPEAFDANMAAFNKRMKLTDH